MAEANSTGATVTMAAETYDAITLRLEQIGAIIEALGIQISETDEIPVSNITLAVSLAGFATFISDIREMMIVGAAMKGGAE